MFCGFVVASPLGDGRPGGAARPRAAWAIAFRRSFTLYRPGNWIGFARAGGVDDGQRDAFAAELPQQVPAGGFLVGEVGLDHLDVVAVHVLLDGAAD